MHMYLFIYVTNIHMFLLKKYFRSSSSLDYVACAQEIQSHAFLSLTPLTFTARERIIREAPLLLERVKVVHAPMIYIQVPPHYKLPPIDATKCFNDADWNKEWNNLAYLLDTFETMRASENEAIRAKGHIEKAIKHLERGIKRWAVL